MRCPRKLFYEKNFSRLRKQTFHICKANISPRSDFTCPNGKFHRIVAHATMLYIRVLHILVSVERDKFLTRREIVAKERIEDLLGKGGIGGSHRDKSTGFGVHRCLPHHLGLIFAKSLGALEGILLITEALDDLCLFEFIVSEIYFILAGYLKERRLCDKDLMLTQKRGKQTVEECQQKSSYLESVLIGIGTDDYLRPTEHTHIKLCNITLDLAVDLNAATDNAQQIGDDLALKDLIIAALHAVKSLSAYGDYRLVLGVSAELTRGKSRITLNYIKLTDSRILGTAIYEFFNSVCNVECTRKLLLNRNSCSLGVLTAALVNKHLICKYLGGGWVLYKVDLEILLEKIGHRVANKLVCDRLLGLVCVRRQGREAVRDVYKAVLNVNKGYL